jgi:hypothetical protein
MRTPLKIAICGVPGTGKTPLAKKLALKLSLPLIYQGTKELRATTDVGQMPPFWRMNEIQRLMYQLNLIQYRLDIESKYGEFVADGCAIDMVAWYRLSSWLVPADQKQATMAGLQKMASNYDYIFYLPFYGIPNKAEDGCEDHVVDPFNLLTADFIIKGTISYMMHAGSKNIYIIQTPQFVATTDPSVDNVELAVDKRVDEVLQVVLAKGTETPTPADQIM